MAPSAAFNVAISVEHIVLRALDFGLGTCWIRLFDEHKIRALFGWDERTHVVVLLPLDTQQKHQHQDQDEPSKRSSLSNAG